MLGPVFKAISSVTAVIDLRVHWQQVCVASNLGYKAMADHLLSIKEGQISYSGTRSDRDFWCAYQKE